MDFAHSDFWQQNTSRLHTREDVFNFIKPYLSLLGKEYEGVILNSLQKLTSVESQLPQDSSVHNLLLLINSLDNEPDVDNRMQNWLEIAKLANFAPLTTAASDIRDAPRLKSRHDVISYVSQLLSSYREKLWPDTDIAYRIVDIAAHYDISPDDVNLYAIWDTATELELPDVSVAQSKKMWQIILQNHSHLVNED